MNLELSISTDCNGDLSNPERCLRVISEAGFTHVHWTHGWDNDYLYSDDEVDEILRWLDRYNLKVLDLHASEGKTANWVSSDEVKRRAGVDLVKNRIRMASRLSTDVIVLHCEPEVERLGNKGYWKMLCGSLDELELYAKKYGVRIALENLLRKNSSEIKYLLSKYDSDFLGFCYDSGHGNLGDGLDVLEELKDRLIAVHLHDNDGVSDEHKLLFSGTIDWERLADILARSSYEKCVNMELMTDGHSDLGEKEFLLRAYEGGEKLTGMIGSC